MKHPFQTTAVDIWSAGVILLSLLSRRYPFFRAHDDMSAMAQIVGLFGSAKCTESARSLGKSCSLSTCYFFSFLFLFFFFPLHEVLLKLFFLFSSPK